MSALNAFRQRYLVRFWSPLPALVALGVASAYYFALTGTFWAVTGEFTRWGGHVLSWFGYQPQDWSYFRLIGLQGTPLDRIDGVMIIGMFLGALCCALWAGNVSLRWPTSKRRLLQGLVGGIVAGFGARLAMGCNLAAFFTGIPMFSLHAWAFMFATVGGAWIGVKISLLPFLRTPLKVGATASALPDAESLARRTRLQARLGLAVLALAALFAAWRFEVSLVLGMACLFGLLFGGLIERAQICFTSAARDLWTTGRTRAAFGILLGMAAACIGTFAAIRLGVAPKIFWMGPNAIIGGILFGIGIVLAGGCETGWMYRHPGNPGDHAAGRTPGSGHRLLAIGPRDSRRYPAPGLQMPGGGAAWRAVPLPHRGAAGKLNERACNDKKADPRVGFLVPGFSAENCAAGAAGLPGW